AAACRSAEHDQAPHFTADREGLWRGSELSWQVAVDLEADADFDKGRGCPRHARFLFILIHRYFP
ncbi:MAG: hypothetical protein ABSE67_10890, partial [Xanthobacteraceae bacterium]